MGMLKGNSSALNFDQLMAQATQVALKQDASLMERARQKRKEAEERRRREEKLERERQEAQAQLNKKRELQDKKQKLQQEQLKKQRESEKKRSQVIKSKPSNAFTKKSVPLSSLLPEKKKPVDMSFDDLMKKAKEQSSVKGDIKPSLPTKKPSDSHTPSLYHPTKRHEQKTTHEQPINARERARQLIAEPPKKVNTQKRDRRSITEIQRDIRRSKGIYSDDDEPKEKLIQKRPTMTKQPLRKRPLSPPPVRKRPLSPPRPKRPMSPPRSKRPISPPRSKRSLSPPRRPVSEKRPPPPPLRRMPFTGKSLDRNKPKRRYREEEEEIDEDLADFVVDDEEDDDPRYARGPRRNSYSDVISKIFKYDKHKYANEPVYSDDDMEADASDVFKEERQSERAGRREDLLEEQKELERLERLKKKRKTQ